MTFDKNENAEEAVRNTHSPKVMAGPIWPGANEVSTGWLFINYLNFMIVA